MGEVIIRDYCVLRKERIKEILELERECREYEKLSCTMYLKRDCNCYSDMRPFFLCYEEKKLIGVLAMFAPDPEGVEISAYVSPKYRKKGIFKMLLEAAEEELEYFNISSYRLVSEPNGKDAEKAAAGLGFEPDYSEYLMEYTKIGKSDEKFVYKCDDIELKRSIIDHDNTNIGHSLTISEEVQVETGILLYELMVKGYKTGEAFCNIEKGSICIYDVSVVEEKRGRGYGKILVRSLVGELQKKYPQTPLRLQVTGKNERALHIYLEAGFKVISEVKYFVKNDQKR